MNLPFNMGTWNSNNLPLPTGTGGTGTGVNNIGGNAVGNINKFLESALGQVVLSTLGGLAGEYGPTSSSNRSLTDAMALLNTARAGAVPSEIDLVKAQTGGVKQDTVQKKYDLKRGLSLNPVNKQGVDLMSKVIAGQGPGQTSLNKFRADQRRTLPLLPGYLYNQLSTRMGS